MGDFVVGIVVNVLGKVRVQYGKRSGVGGIAGPAGNFPVLNPSEFVVLNPEVAFEDFSCSRKAKECRISLRESLPLLSP